MEAWLKFLLVQIVKLNVLPFEKKKKVEKLWKENFKEFLTEYEQEMR